MTTRLVRAWQLPLLTKELSEHAARTRTYTVRFVYAGLIFVVACVQFYGSVVNGDGSVNVLGQGRSMFGQLVTLQFWGICLLLPGMVCGMITSEKERDSLGLLLLTTLSPWQIIIQKLFSRVIPMIGFLFISFPLMAIAFSYGGVTSSHLWAGILLLVLTCLQIGSLSIMCSAFFRSTQEAFIASYLSFLVLYFMIPPMFAPYVFEEADGLTPVDTAANSLLIVISTFGFIVLARVFLETRACVLPRNYLLQLFKELDAIYMDMNSMTGGIMITRDLNVLPGNEPIAWRETSKKTLGTVRYLFRVLVVLETPLLFTFQLVRYPGGEIDVGGVTVLLYVLWGVSVPMVAVHAAGLISSERSRQTLDVLLTTPLDGRAMILQKFRGVRRLICVLCIPFLSVFAFECWFKYNCGWEYLLWSLLCVVIYLPLTAWFALWLGLRIRSQVRATTTAVCAILICLTLPLAVRYLLAVGFGVDSSDTMQYLQIMSPAIIIPSIQTTDPVALGIPDPYWACYLANFVLYGVLLWTFRRQCLKNIDPRLGRVPVCAAKSRKNEQHPGKTV